MHYRTVLLAFISIVSLSFAAGDTLQYWNEVAARSRSNVIKLDDNLFDELIAAERNYTTIVCFTALPAQFQCTLCREFDPVFSSVAYSWRKAHPQSDGVFFAKLDFPEGRPIFVRFGMQSAPNVWVYPPTIGPLSKLSSNNQPIVYEFPGSGINAEPFHRFLQANIKLPAFPLVRPFNWGKLFGTILIVVVLGTITKLAWPAVKEIAYKKNVWAVACLVTILMFTSGHMFNSIRHTPFAQPNGQGGLTYIAGGFQYQFGIETQIVAAIYGLLAFTTVALALKAPTIRDPVPQLVVICIWTGGILLIYSFLIHIFRIKNSGYPFKLVL